MSFPRCLLRAPPNIPGLQHLARRTHALSATHSSSLSLRASRLPGWASVMLASAGTTCRAGGERNEFTPDRSITGSFVSVPGTLFTVDGARAWSNALKVYAGSCLATPRLGFLAQAAVPEIANEKRAWLCATALPEAMRLMRSPEQLRKAEVIALELRISRLAVTTEVNAVKARLRVTTEGHAVKAAAESLDVTVRELRSELREHGALQLEPFVGEVAAV